MPFDFDFNRLIFRFIVANVELKSFFNDRLKPLNIMLLLTFNSFSIMMSLTMERFM